MRSEWKAASAGPDFIDCWRLQYDISETFKVCISIEIQADPAAKHPALLCSVLTLPISGTHVPGVVVYRDIEMGREHLHKLPAALHEALCDVYDLLEAADNRPDLN